MTEETDQTSSKTYPKWDGTKEKWPRFRTEMEGAISSQSRFETYSTALRSASYHILKPSEQSTKATEAEKKLEEKLRRADIELFRILGTCLERSGEGAFVYQLVPKSKAGGYTDGSFKAAWNLLIKVFERKVKEDLRKSGSY